MAPVLAGVMALAGCGGEAQAPAAPQESAAAEPEAVPVSGPPVRILAFGNSLFAGYNVGEGESYPAVLEAALRRRGINATVVNAGVSGDTTQAGRQRLAFVLDNADEAPDLAIVELGGNDLLRGIPPAETRRNLEAILAALGERDVPVLLMGMRAPPNLGADFVSEFDAIYPELAEASGAALVPFFLEAVYDRPAFIQPDRVHPNAEGIEALVAATQDEVIAALPPPEAAD
jgi:acyl-CoA thioesterase-1